MTEHLSRLPSTQPEAGDLFVFETVSGARYVLGTDGSTFSAMTRVRRGEPDTVAGWYGAVALAPGTNFRGETVPRPDGPPRLGAPMRVYVMGEDEWETSTTVVAIRRLAGPVARERFDVLVETLRGVMTDEREQAIEALVAIGAEYDRDKASVLIWMHSGSRSLGDRAPAEFLTDDFTAVEQVARSDWSAVW